MVFDPIHYLPRIERKLSALDQAAPLAEWALPEELDTLRRLMEARMLNSGRREHVQVRCFLENFGMDELYAAVRRFLKMGEVDFDAVSIRSFVRSRNAHHGSISMFTPACHGLGSRQHQRSATCP